MRLSSHSDRSQLLAGKVPAGAFRAPSEVYLNEPASDERDETLFQPGGATSQSRVGPYRLIQLLGEGGMGEVWRAEQVYPLQRAVALKLIKTGMDTRFGGPFRI